MCDIKAGIVLRLSNLSANLITRTRHGMQEKKIVMEIALKRTQMVLKLINHNSAFGNFYSVHDIFLKFDF